MTTAHRIFIAVLAFISLASSAPGYAAAGWTNIGQITELNQQPGANTSGAGLVFIETTVTVNPAGCTVNGGFYFATSDDRLKRIFASLLAAHMSGRDVLVYVTGTCQWGYAQMDGLIVK